MACATDDGRASADSVPSDPSPEAEFSAEGAPETRVEHYARPLLGVRFELTLVGGAQSALDELAEEAFGVAAAVERLANNWDPQSELSRLNRSESTDPLPVSAELAELLECALAGRERTGGAFDPSVGCVLEAMGFYGGEQRLLQPDELDALRPLLGAHTLRLERADGAQGVRLWRAAPQVHVDLSALAKGWAVDRVVELLRERGVRRAFVAAGGSTVYGLGPGPPGEELGGWTFQVPDGVLWRTWWLADEAVSTSGRISMPLDPGGERVSHLIDPRTARPVEAGWGMSVFRGPSAAQADLASTALLVLGREEALALFEPQAAWGERAGLLVGEDGALVELGAGLLPR